MFEGVSGAVFYEMSPETHPTSLTLWKLGDTDTPWCLDPHGIQEDPRIHSLRERSLVPFTELNLTLSHTLHSLPNS